MMEAFLITSRETLEASLVVGIVLAYLHKTNNHNYKKTVYYGIVFGILISVLSAFAFTFLAGGFEGRTEAIFEGLTMLIGAALLTTMILWMMRQKHITSEIQNKVAIHLQQTPTYSHFGIFTLIAIAILREGVETVIFLNAIKFANGINFIGATIGIIVAVFAGYLFFVGSKKVNLRKMFNISSILLILFAAGLVAHGVHELQEAAVIPEIIYPLFDINPAQNIDGSFPILHEKGLIGGLMKGLFGYNGNPGLLEVLAYLAYLIPVGYLFFRKDKIIQKPTSLTRLD